MQTSLVSVIQERPAIKCTGLVVLLLVAAILVWRQLDNIESWTQSCANDWILHLAVFL